MRRSDIIVVASLLISYVLYCGSTLLNNEVLILLFSPVTCFLTGLLILLCLDRMGSYKTPSLLLALGIFMYCLADVLDFINALFVHEDFIDDLITIIYLLPNYFFGVSVAAYFFQKLKGRQFYQFLINSFILTVVGFVAFVKLLQHLGSFNTLESFELVRIYLYFFINFFIIIMVVHMVYMIASESGLKGTNTMIIGIIVYIILDIPYTWQQAIGNDPENNYQNLLYMFCMMLMAHGIFHQIRHHHSFTLKAYTYTEKAVRRTTITVVAGIALSILLMSTGFLSRNEFLYLLIAFLAYWIMTSTLHNGALNEQLLKQQDLLTGLYNRRYLATVMDMTVQHSRDNGERFAVFCIDLNSFKPINDTYGHEMGDQVLKEFGKRMLALPPDHISFRTGGDEFMIVKKDINKDPDINDTAMKIQKLFNTPVKIESYVFHLSGSIGIAVFPDDSEDSDVLIRYADAAMYSIKHSSQKDGFRTFDRSLVEHVERHKYLETKLKDADPAKDFALYYQPRFSAENGELIGVEVFPRLKGDDSFSAAQLLPIAEETGIMNRLSRWIAETALKQLCKWNTDKEKELYININLSPLQLLDQDFMDYLKSLTRELSFETGLIHLDVGNDVIMGNSGTAKEALQHLSSCGFSLALNDFGGDDINLRHILDCGFSSISLSPALIHRADTDPDAETLIRAVITLTESLKVSASAVGIETEAQERKLKEMGVSSLQGFYYGRPQDRETFETSFL